MYIYIKKFYLSLEILKIWIDLILGFSNQFTEIRLNERNNLIFKTLTTEQNLFEMFIQILSVHLFSNKQIKDSLISTCGINVIDEHINEIKGKVIDWFIKLMNVFYSNFSENQQIRAIFANNMINIANLSIKSLLSFCRNYSANFLSFIEHKKNEFFLIKLLNFISKSTSQIEFFQTIFNVKTELGNF